MSMILLVDDDQGLTAAMSSLFQLDGHTVIITHNGSDGLDRLRRDPKPALILLDLAMPVMDGWEFLRHKNADPAIAGIPTVVMSGTKTAMPEGAVSFFRKPGDIDRLLSLVKQQLDQARS